MDQLQKKNGLIAGTALILMAIVAGFSFGFAHPNFVSDSPLTTYEALVDKRGLFIAEVLGWCVIFILDLVVALTLYKLFEEVSRKVSGLTAFIRILYTLILGWAIYQLFQITSLTAGGEMVGNETSAAQAFDLLSMFEHFWSLGLVVFGLHLIGLGYLVIKSGFVSKWLGYLLYLAGASYTFVHGARQISLLDAELIDTVDQVLALPMGLSEILLAIVLVVVGVRKKG